MKKFLISALTATMLTAPVIGAQAAPVVPMQKSDSQVQTVQYMNGKRVVKKRTVVRNNGKVVRKKVVTKRWNRGGRVPGWQRYRAVEYNRYGLNRPPRGYRWVRVDNDFLLIAIGSGLIASIIAGR